MPINPQPNKKELARIVTALKSPATRRQILTIIGQEGENWFKKSFRDEGFTDTTLVKWQPSKRLTALPAEGKKAKKRTALQNRPTLTQSGDLGDSITWENAGQFGVKFASDLDYAKVQNEGGRAGRKLAARIPKRQFMGKSELLNLKIMQTIRTQV
ncbi:phage virion morphogenesis protein [Pseudarcicella hirudinis]